MTQIEKIIIGGMITVVVGIGFLSYGISKEIEDAGGVRGIVVETGKGIKSIINDINTEEYNNE